MKFLLGVFALFSTISYGKTYDVVKADGNTIEWVAVGNPGFLKINAEGGYSEGKVTIEGDELSVDVVCKPEFFKTGMELRDDHMKNKYLMVSQFPNSTLKIEKMKFKAGEEFEWTGVLQIKNESKPAKGKAKIIKSDAGYNVESTFIVSMKEYPSIGVPKYLGITMAEDITVTAKISLKD